MRLLAGARSPQFVGLVLGLALALVTSAMVTSSSREAGAEEGESGAALPAPGEVSRRLDEILAEDWKANELVPSPRATDAELLRRLSLDLRGAIPDLDEVRAFLADSFPDRISRRADEWLEGPAFADNLARTLTEVLPAIRPGIFRLWLRDAIRAGRPWDEVVTELITSDHPRSWNGSTNFLLRWSKDAEEMASATARLLLGIQLQCAQCHDHPDGKWTQADFYGLTAFFARTERLPINMRRLGLTERLGELDFDLAEVEDRDVYADADAGGFAVLPRAEAGDRTRLLPAFLGGAPVADGKEGRREALARLVAGEGGLQLARAYVNRVFQALFGRGVVDPVDDFGAHNPPSHPRLLELLAEDFCDSGYDMKRPWRVLLGTRAYALSSSPGAMDRDEKKNRDDGRSFSRAALRQLRPNQLFDSVLVATGNHLPAAGGEAMPEDVAALYERFDAIVKETRAAQREGGDDLRGISTERSPHCTESMTIPREEREKMIAAGFEVPIGIRDPTRRDAGEQAREAFLAEIRAVKLDDDPMAVSVRGIQSMLVLLNGSFLHDAITAAPGGRPGAPRTVDRALTAKDPAAAVALLYHSALAREPTAAESKAAIGLLSGEAGSAVRRESIEDLLWALVNSVEFLFNH